MFYTTIDSPVGIIWIVSDGEAINGVWLEGQKYFLATLKEEPVRNDELQIFVRAREWFRRYFSGGKPDGRELPLRPMGSAFRQQVWQCLLDIPYGKTTTYGRLAKVIAESRGEKSMSAQAIGGAVGHNPISIIIPCHRVVGADGSLTGYAGGIEKKAFLIKLEQEWQ